MEFTQSNADTDGSERAHDPLGIHSTPIRRPACPYIRVISGDRTGVVRQTRARSYIAFKPNMLFRLTQTLNCAVYLTDPFGNSYGYSTAEIKSSAPNGYNPTFDLWSTADRCRRNPISSEVDQKLVAAVARMASDTDALQFRG